MAKVDVLYLAAEKLIEGNKKLEQQNHDLQVRNTELVEKERKYQGQNEELAQRIRELTEAKEAAENKYEKLMETNKELQQELEKQNNYPNQHFRPGEVAKVADPRKVALDGIDLEGGIREGDKVIICSITDYEDDIELAIVAFYFLHETNKDAPWVSYEVNFKRIEED